MSKKLFLMLGLILIAIPLMGALGYGVYLFMDDNEDIQNIGKMDLQCTIEMEAFVVPNSHFAITEATCVKLEPTCGATYSWFDDWLYEDGNLILSANNKQASADTKILRSGLGSDTKTLTLNCISDSTSTALIQLFGEDEQLDDQETITITGDISQQGFSLWDKIWNNDGSSNGNINFWLIITIIILVLIIIGIVVGLIYIIPIFYGGR